MATIVRVSAEWSGFAGAPGFTHWYGLSDGDAGAAGVQLSARMRTFFDAIKSLLPANTNVKVQRVFQVLDSTNGNLTSELVNPSDPLVVGGTSAASYAAPAGMCVNWETGFFNANGRRVRGRTYLVPLAGFMENDGTVSGAALTLVTGAATAAIGGTGSLGVWTRPAPGGGGSNFNLAITPLVKDKVAILTSRRD